MINSRIYSILLTFSKKDWKEFNCFLKASDLITGKNTQLILSELSKYSERLHILKGIPASEILEKAYSKTFSHQTVLNKQNQFLNLLKEFVGYTQYKNNDLFKTYFYFEGLFSRNIENVFSYEYGKVKETIEKNCYDENSFNLISRIVRENLWFVLNNKRNLDNGIETAYKYEKVILAEILSNLYRTGQEQQILKHQKISRNNYLLDFINSIDSDSFFEKIERQNKPEFIIPLIHYYIFKSLQNLDSKTVNKKYITKAKQIFFTNENHFSEEFKVNIYMMMTSYYNAKINNGEINYNKDKFMLFKRKINNNIISDIPELFSGGFTLFSQYITAGLSVKEYKWVEMFIEKYSHMLPEKIRKDEYTLAMIKIHFSKGEYQKTIETIINNKINNIYYYSDSREFKLMCYFELKEYEECYKELDNARHQYKNNKIKILFNHFKRFKKFLDGFSILLNYKTNPFNKDFSSITYEFEKLDIPKESWIYEKLQEISEKKQ